MRRLHSEKLVGIGYLLFWQYNLVSGQYCDIAISKDTFHASDFSFPVNKNFPHLEMFNRRYLIFTDRAFNTTGRYCFQSYL